jgi:hypothetical protein
MWIDSVGFLHVFGEIENTGDMWLRFVKITGTLRDANNAIVDVVLTYTSAMFLPPGSIVPFDMLEVDTARSARVRTYTLVVEFRETAAISQKLVVMNVADSKNSLGWFEVVGEVENRGDTPSTYTEVIGTFYDDASKVIYVGFTYTSPNEIPAGARYGFKLSVLSGERTGKITRYAVVAESEDSGYTSVPELSSPMLVAGVILLFGIIAARSKSRRIDRRAT